MIFINGRFLTQKMTGVQRFSEQVTTELLRMSDEYTVIAPEVALRSDSSIDEGRILRIGGRSGHLWEQLDLPKFLASNGRPMLLNLASTAPAFYANQFSTHHDITYVRHPESFSPKFRMLYRVLVPRFLRSSRKIVTVSEFSRGEISDHYGLDPKKFLVVKNAAGDMFRPGADHFEENDRVPYFLAVSSPNLHKNFERLVEAFLKFRNASGSRSRLLIIGDQAKSFSQQASRTDLPGIVEYVGRVDDARLVKLYQEARAFVFPSLYEGFGIPPVEAQQCGCPVISSTAASLPEVLGDSVEYFDPYATDSIVQALARVDSDENLRRSLHERGLANAARYSWQDSAAVIHSALQEGKANIS